MKRFLPLLLIAAGVLLQSCVTNLPPSSVPRDNAKVLEIRNARPASLAEDERFSAGGLPVSKSRAVVVLKNIGYAVGFSEELRHPLWAAYFCAKDAPYKNQDGPSKFSPDERIAREAQLSHNDYDRPAGATPTYDRGHMAPNYAMATRYGRAAQVESYKLTNVSPQRTSLNQNTWRALEAEIPHNFAQRLDGVWVIVGPIFKDPIVRYNGKAAIPEAYFFIVLDRTETGQLRALALTMNQSVTGQQKLSDFLTTIRDIEKQTGLDFCSLLPDDIEDKLETTAADNGWDRDLILKVNKYGKEN